MAIPAIMTDSMAAFFDRNPLAESGTYTPVGGNPRECYMHFNDEFQVAQRLQVPLDTAQPMAFVKESDFSAVKRGEPVIVRDTTYKIVAIHPTGAGTINLILSQTTQHR